MDNQSTHDDDAAIIRANAFIADPWDEETAVAVALVRDLLNRVLEKKVEIRGLESQINNLKNEVKDLKEIFVGD